MTPQEAVREAAKRVGGQARLAAALGLRQPTIAQWIRRNYVPPQHVLPIEYLTKVNREFLNPAIYPPTIVIDDTAAPTDTPPLDAA